MSIAGGDARAPLSPLDFQADAEAYPIDGPGCGRELGGDRAKPVVAEDAVGWLPAGDAWRIARERRRAVDAQRRDIGRRDEVRSHDGRLAEARSGVVGAPFVIQQVQHVLHVEHDARPAVADPGTQGQAG